MNVILDGILTEIEDELTETFEVLASAVSEDDVEEGDVELAQVLALAAYRTYTQVAQAADDLHFPKWPSPEGRMMATAVSRLAGYSFITSLLGENQDDTIDKLIEDTRINLAQALEGQEEE